MALEIRGERSFLSCKVRTQRANYGNEKGSYILRLHRLAEGGIVV